MNEMLAIKQAVTRYNKKAQEDAGVLKTLMVELEDVYQCYTVEQAKDKLEDLHKQIAALEAEFQIKLGEFKQQYGKLLNVEIG